MLKDPGIESTEEIQAGTYTHTLTYILLRFNLVFFDLNLFECNVCVHVYGKAHQFIDTRVKIMFVYILFIEYANDTIYYLFECCYRLVLFKCIFL